MIKRELTYTNYVTGKEEKEVAYFHLNKADMIRIVGRSNTDWETHIKNVMDSGDTDKILDLIEEVIGTSYGAKSEDGRSFIKDREEQKKFINSEPYAELMAEFIQDPNSAEAFFKGVVGVSGETPKARAAKKSATRKK